MNSPQNALKTILYNLFLFNIISYSRYPTTINIFVVPEKRHVTPSYPLNYVFNLLTVSHRSANKCTTTRLERKNESTAPKLIDHR